MKIAIIGAGNMGAAIARGIVASGFRAEVVLANPSKGRLEAIAKDCPEVVTTSDNVSAVGGADVVILAVKPWILPGVVAQLKPHLDYGRQAVVSIAGGVGLDALDSMLEKSDVDCRLPQLFYVIPDTAISVGKGLSFIAERRATASMSEVVSGIFSSMGECAIVEERLMAAATALSSCGISYVYKFIQAYVQAGVELGFRPADALRYTLATVDGAVAMLRGNGTLPQQEIDRVTTPGGMTIRGINSLEHSGFTSSVIKAILAPLKK